MALVGLSKDLHCNLDILIANNRIMLVARDTFFRLFVHPEVEADHRPFVWPIRMYNKLAIVSIDDRLDYSESQSIALAINENLLLRLVVFVR